MLGRYVPQLSFLHVVLGDQDVLSTEIQLYQRLLAMDHAEARAVVDRFLKDRPLLDLYEQIMIPTLILAEQERHRGTLEPSRKEFIWRLVSQALEQALQTHPLELPIAESSAGVPVGDL